MYPACRWRDHDSPSGFSALESRYGKIHGSEQAATLILSQLLAGEADDMDAAPSGATLLAVAGDPSTPSPPPTEIVLPPQLGPAEVSPVSGQAKTDNPGSGTPRSDDVLGE